MSKIANDIKPMTDAQRTLAEKNTSLVWLVMRRHFQGNPDEDELVSAGYLGLCKAATTWDASKGTFSTYACKVIRNQILLELRWRNKSVPPISLETEIYEDMPLEEVIAGDEDIEVVDITIDNLLSGLTDIDKQVFKLLSEGYRVKEIEKITNLTFNQIKWIKKKIKKRYLNAQKSK